MQGVALEPTEIDELFRRYAVGEAEVFSRLYDLASPKVWGFIIKRISNEAFAEEIFQEVWARIHRTRELYDPIYPALPWIFTLTRSVWADALRRQRSRPEVPVESEELERIAGAEGEAVQDGVSWSELAPKLVPGDREMLEDRYLKEWSFEAIARKLNLSEAGVRQRISRILRKIRSEGV